MPAGIEPDWEGLLNGGVLNGDGSGWAIAAEGKIIIGKSMEVCDAIDEFSLARERYMDGPAIFHSRWATHGTTTINNVHPFYMGGSDKTVMAHNGILQCTPGKNDWRSDTRLFAEDILSTRFKRLDKRRAFTAMEKFCGGYNKLAILTVDPRYQNNLYMVNERAGHWDKLTGNWHSNYDYLGWSKYSGSTVSTIGYTSTISSRAKAMTGNDDKLCYICEFGNYTSSGYCDECGTCEDCLENKLDCQCYLGATWDEKDDDIILANAARQAELDAVFEARQEAFQEEVMG
jgi:glutamine amidotransferase